ncbi:hypothetical protein HK099_000949 [Clydaea vesicula]|uniref:Uncharacterized protein n=1 Tax=Clydaea vesicula TaxID=447962 RepID=A0AAD5XSL0_9FUNG|nr:hypothetical protein HK099_000949 [Clydaea vesicula]KAJ3387298.1 hypothetical protein HDU92_002005 [Lobulomyces angularis]
MMKFGDPTTTCILIGDWSVNSQKCHAPTKGKGFRTMFRRAGYAVHLVNEHKTSETCQLNLNGKVVNRLWNRDDLATMNIKSVVMETLQNNEPPTRFRKITPEPVFAGFK